MSPETTAILAWAMLIIVALLVLAALFFVVAQHRQQRRFERAHAEFMGKQLARGAERLIKAMKRQERREQRSAE